MLVLQAVAFLKTQLTGTTTTHYVPIESPEALVTRMDILTNELDAAEYESEKLMKEINSMQQLCTTTLARLAPPPPPPRPGGSRSDVQAAAA